MRIIATLALALACCSSGSDNASDSQPNETGDKTTWFTASCDELGGVESPKGACYIDCSEGKECPDETVCGYGSAVHKFCKIPFKQCKIDTDCGPKGWDCYEEGSCNLPCSNKTKQQSDECPEGMSCEGSFCIQGVSAPDTCPSSCKHPTNPDICCKPPFCTGNCAGSSCC